MNFTRTAAAVFASAALFCGVMTSAPVTAAPANFQVIQPQEAKAMMDKGGVLILDVRTPQEFAEGHIAGAVNVPLQTMKVGIRLDNVADDQPILVYCKSGRRAALASDLLSFSGYTKVYNFLGVKQWPYELVK